MSKMKTTWSFGKGIGWAIPCGIGALFGVKKQLAHAIGFNDDYSLLLLVFAVSGVALWLGGLRRVPQPKTSKEDAHEQSKKDSKNSSPKPASKGAFVENDNIGTRYETEERVHDFWAPYVAAKQATFPYVFYDMEKKDDAMNAMISLPCIELASDSGKLISTEVLLFGVYQKRSIWGFFLAGDQMTKELYKEAIASCEKNNGTNPRVSEPPKNQPKTAKKKSSAVTFDFEEKVDMLEQMRAQGMEIEGADLSTRYAFKHHHKGSDKESAMAFLKSNPVNKPFFYHIVHTPEGVFGRDQDGIFEQPD